MSGEGEDTLPAESGMSDEQGADFAAIMKAAEAPEKQIEQAQEKEQAQALDQAVQETAMLIEAGWDLLGGMLPEKVAARYGPEQRARIALSGTKLAIKRGWSSAEFMAKWGPEVAFAAALVGPSVPLVIEWIKKPKDAKPASAGVLEPPAVPEQAIAAPEAPSPPGARVVQFGTVQP